MSSIIKTERGTYSISFYYKDWDGKTKRKKKEGFARKKDAIQYEKDFLDRLNPSADMSFDILISLYREDCEKRLKQTTMDRKLSRQSNHITPFFTGIKIMDITPAMIRQWQSEILDKGLKKSSQKIINTELNSILNFAVKYYNLPKNPASTVDKIGTLKTDNAKIWTTEEFEQFIQAIEDPQAHLIFNILFWSGLRIGELLALTKQSFDFSAGTISVEKNLVHTTKGLLLVTPKTEKSKRTLFMPDFIMKEAEEYIDHLYQCKPEQMIFTIRRKTLHCIVKRVSEQVGLQPIKLHSFRHSHASFLIEHSFPPTAIADRLGHETVQTTLTTYAHLYENKRTEIANFIQNFQEERKNN